MWPRSPRVRSVCRPTVPRGDATFGGGSVIADPEGIVLARSTPGSPLTTAEIDLELADRAKDTYPRYVDASS